MTSPTSNVRANTPLTVEVGTSFKLLTADPTWAFFRVKPADCLAREECFTVRRTDIGSAPLLTPELATDRTAGGADSPQFTHRIELPNGPCEVVYRALVEVPDVSDPMPESARAPRLSEFTAEHWWWIQPTRYCRPDELGQEAWAVFGGEFNDGEPATGRTVRNICSYVDDRMRFAYGSSTSFTSATEAWNAREGVCRDFNHIAVSFCRALNIPARYAFGYLPNIEKEPTDAEMDFCAWFEVFLDNGWHTFDARVNRPRIGRIVVGRGRDAADVPMVSTMGAVELSDFVVSAHEFPVG